MYLSPYIQGYGAFKVLSEKPKDKYDVKELLENTKKHPLGFQFPDKTDESE